MFKSKSLIVPLSVLAVIAMTGCNGNTSASKIVKAANATVERVNTFNKVLGDCNFGESSSASNEEVSYDASDLEEYCEEQNFGFYIYNNIHYALKYFYGDNVSSGTVVTGKTRQVPDKKLKEYYDDPLKELPDTTLSAKVEVKSENNKTIVNFQADWDFRNEFFKTADSPMNSVILTNGRIIYNEKTSKAEKLMINYYWTNKHRSFGSYTMDFLNDKFYFLDGGGVSDISTPNYTRWTWQTKVGENGTIHTIWNDGSLNTTNMLDYKYYVYEAYTGSIKSSIGELGMEGYKRILPDATDEPSEPTPTEATEKWQNKIMECYNVNKELALRSATDMLDTSNAKSVNIDMCPKYAEAKTKLLWLYSSGSYLRDSIIPFMEKDELVKNCDKLSNISSLTTGQVNLINKAKNYYSSLKESEYLCESDNDDFKFEYVHSFDGTQTPYFNCFKTNEFSYLFTDKSEPSIKVNFKFANNGEIAII